MKRYLLFASDYYYPAGGWSDFLGAYDTIEEARDQISTLSENWYQIVDLETLEAIEDAEVPRKTNTRPAQGPWARTRIGAEGMCAVGALSMLAQQETERRSVWDRLRQPFSTS